MVLHPLQRQRPARDKVLDTVSAGAQRLLQRRRRDIAFAALAIGGFPPMLRQNGELANNLRQFTIAWRIEAELYVAIADFFSLR